jgi:hypothetical protein
VWALADISVELDSDALHSESARAGLVLLAAFLLSFLLIRTSTRLMRSPKVPWWPGSIKTGGGLHIHHLVFGIVMMIVAGFVAIAFHLRSPWLEIVAGVFGAGVGLTLDEYALWLHLEDVYWSEEGRSSINAVVIAAVVADDTGSVIGIVIALVAVFGLSVVAALKGRLMLAIVGVLIPFVSIWAICRLAKPGSPWARRQYPPGGRRDQRAQARWERHEARYRRVQDLLGGAPSRPSPLLARQAAGAASVETDQVAADPDRVSPGA